MKIPESTLTPQQQEGYKIAIATVFQVLEEEKRLDNKGQLYHSIEAVEAVLAFRFQLTEKEHSIFQLLLHYDTTGSNP